MNTKISDAAVVAAMSTFNDLEGFPSARMRAALAAALPHVAADAVPVEIPTGAIVNGAAFADRLERDYQFECQAGPLVNCSDYVEFRRCFDHLAQWASQLPTLYLHPQPAALNEVGEIPALIAEAIGYLDLIAVQPPLVDQARRALARALAATGKQQGGEVQGDALLESLVTRWRKDADELGTYDNTLCQKIANCTMRHAAELQAVIAARQPVVSSVGPGPYLDEPDSQHHPLWKRLRSIANWLADIAPNCHMEAAQLLLTASSIVKRNEEQPAQGIDLGQFRSAVEGWRESLDRVVADTSATQSARRVAAGRVGEAIRLLALIDQRDAGAECNCHPETCACDSQLGRSP